VGRLLLLGGGWWLAAAAAGQCGVRLYCIILYNHNMYMYIHVCVCGVGLGGRAQRAAAHQWWASYKVRIAQSFTLCLLQQQHHGGKVRARLLHACLPAALVAASGRRRRDGTYFDPSTSDGSFAAGHTNTHTQHAMPRP
jgi:hypothetical protein